LILFGVIMLGASLLLSALGGQQSSRILLDLGCGAIEFFALLGVGFSAVTLVLEEMESKTIYLILTRPLSRFQYLAGRYCGLLMAIYAGMLVMALMHIVLLLFNGWAFQSRYLLALFLSAEKILVIGSVALFFSIFSSSAITSVSFTIFFWILGHFSGEINYLGTKLPSLLAKITIGSFYYIIPNMQYFNLRDFWDVPQVVGNWVWMSFAYGFIYSAVFVLLTAFLFSRKEF
jgi:ABC-type transport system involved in multi-copper enzyme maturation permease subunit